MLTTLLQCRREQNYVDKLPIAAEGLWFQYRASIALLFSWSSFEYASPSHGDWEGGHLAMSSSLRLLWLVICAGLHLSAGMKRRGGCKQKRAVSTELAGLTEAERVEAGFGDAPKKRSRLGNYLVIWRGVFDLAACKEIWFVHVEFHVELIRNS